MILFVILILILADSGISMAIPIAAWFGSHILATILLCLLFA